MGMNRHRGIGQGCAAALMFIMAISTAATVEAEQAAQSFSELGTFARPGDSVIVTDGAGRKVHGRIATLSPASVELIVPDPRVVAETRRVFREGDVKAVSLRNADPLKDGVLKGLGFGALAGAVVGAFAVQHQLGGSAGAGAAGGAIVGGAWGSLIGLVGDASVRATTMIYSKPASGAARLRLSPMVGRDSKGVRLAVAF